MNDNDPTQRQDGPNSRWLWTDHVQVLVIAEAVARRALTGSFRARTRHISGLR